MESQQQQNQPMEDGLKTGQWTHGLFGCFDNLAVCVVAYFVPCVTFGQTRQRLTGEGCILYGLLYLVPCLNCFLHVKQREDIRTRRGIPGGLINDFCIIWCCQCCALMQEEQEAIHLSEQALGMQAVVNANVQGAIVIGGQNPSMYPPAPGQAYVTAPEQPPPYPVDSKATEMERM